MLAEAAGAKRMGHFNGTIPTPLNHNSDNLELGSKLSDELDPDS